MTSGIKNKIARSELYGKLKHVRALEKKKLRVARQKAHARALEAGGDARAETGPEDDREPARA